MTDKYIVIRETGFMPTAAYLYERVEGDPAPTYSKLATGTIRGIEHLATMLNRAEETERALLELKPAPARQTELVDPCEVRPGDEVLMKLTVSKYDDGYGHIYARASRDTIWVLGDQEVWTWNSRQALANHETRIERIVKEVSSDSNES